MDTETLTMTPFEKAAMVAHELFITLQGAGFNEDQAIKLVIGMMNSGSFQADN